MEVNVMTENKLSTEELNDKLLKYVQQSNSIYTDTVVDTMEIPKSDLAFISEQVGDFLKFLKMTLDNERYFCKYYIYGQKKEIVPTIEFLNIEQVGNYFPFEEINDEVYEDIPFGIAINFITFDLKRFSYILIIS